MNFYVPCHVVPARRTIIKKILLVMRLSCILLLAGVLHASAKGVSQTITYTGKEVSLEKLFSVIKEQTGYVVFYKYAALKNSRPVSVNVKNASLEMFLDKALNGQNLGFTITKRTIVVTSPGTTVAEVLAAIPPVDVKGRVVDQQGKPVQGAFVKIKAAGRHTSAFTNENGEFVLEGADAFDILLITSVNMEPVEYPLKGNTNVTIEARLKTADLDTFAVQVNTGYQVLPRERATGSFGVVTAKQLSQYPVVSVLERLQGLVPGVDISTKTTAGKSRNGTIVIRGQSTIKSSLNAMYNVSTDPLLVIDGFPSQLSITNGALDFLNPDDIEQVTFLKDAAAASIWGIQASNGVIVITTKKGSRNSKTSLNFSATIGTSKRPKANYGKMMSGTDYVAMEKELIEKGRLNDPTKSTSSFYPENSSQAQTVVFQFRRGEISEEEMNKQLAMLAALDNSDQISQLMLQPPTTRQYNLSLSGGGVNNSYFVSGYMYNEDRVYKSNVNKGYSVRAGNVASLLNGRVTVSSDLTLGNTRDKVNAASVLAMSVAQGGMRPYDMLEDANGNVKYYDVLTTPAIARGLEQKGYLPFRYSPVDELNYSNTYNTANNITVNLAVNANITSWLNASVSGNFGRVFTENETYWEPDSYNARIMVNKGTSVGTAGNAVNGVPVGGKLDLNNALTRNYAARGQLNVNKRWQGIHQLSAALGTEIRETFNKSSGELRYGYDKAINAFRSVNPTVTYKDMYGSTQSVGATSKLVTEKTTRALSYYANGAYTFDNKYTASASIRFDDFNLLGVERRKRAIPLWSGGLKWNMKNEGFMKSLSWLNQLNARFTYGFTGNAPQGAAPVTIINLLGADFYTGYPNANISSPAIDNLAWEKTRMMNYGIDFSLFKSRFSGSVEYYRKRSTDIIWSMPINGTYGFSNMVFNTATLDGKGVDIGLNVVPVLSKTVKLTTTLNLSYNTNVISDSRFKAPVGSLGSDYLYDGYPTDYMFSYSWAGLDNTGQSVIKDPKVPGKTYSVLEYPYYDIREYSGRTTSPWFGSFSNALQYKNFELNVQLQYMFGGVFRKPSINSVGYTNNLYVGRGGDLAERWKKPGDEAFTNVPGLEFGPNTVYAISLSRYTESDYLIRSRSNVRLQQISLSYNVPGQLLSKFGIKGLSLSATCRNLGMIWAANKEKLDPDYLYNTGNNYQLSPVVGYSFRAGINF